MIIQLVNAAGVEAKYNTHVWFGNINITPYGFQWYSLDIILHGAKNIDGTIKFNEIYNIIFKNDNQYIPNRAHSYYG